VDSRGEDYRWNVRRVGASRRLKKGSAKPGAPLVMRAPNGFSGVYLLEVRHGRFTSRVPFLVQSAERAPILVVVPAISWVGADVIDDDGDGLPNSLPLGTAVRHPRPFAGVDGEGLPVGFADQTAPLLAFLDRSRVRYDVTSDLALTGSEGPSPTDREGVLVAGPARWIPAGDGPPAAALRGTRRPGRDVRGRLHAPWRHGDGRAGCCAPRSRRRPTPSGPACVPSAGWRVPVALVPLDDDPRLGLLEERARDSPASGFSRSPSPRAAGRSRCASRVGEDRGDEAPIDPETGAPEAPRPALTGSRLRDGVVIRVGLGEWGRRLRDDADVQQITRNIADILRRVRPRPRSPLR
jgi:hypothetical protein